MRWMIIKKRIGLIFQNYNLISHMTLLENVEIAMRISNIDKSEREKRASELLDIFSFGYDLSNLDKELLLKDYIEPKEKDIKTFLIFRKVFIWKKFAYKKIFFML